MLEKWKRALDKGEYVSALFMGLSKAFDTINHDLLIVKLKFELIFLGSSQINEKLFKKSETNGAD